MVQYKNIYITLKATLKCNLACKYCYGRDNHDSGAEMSDEEIRTAIDFAVGYCSLVRAKSVVLCWHGGEPFLLARRLSSLISYANKEFAKANVVVAHAIQTNATLLLPCHYDLIKKYFNGYVGVSLDLFSSYRVFPNGELSFSRAITNIDRAIASGIRCGAINLITKDNVNHVDEIYDFYKKRGMNVRLPRVFPINPNEVLAKSDMYTSDEEYATALIKFFNRWANDPTPVNNTDIVKLIADLLLGIPSICLREEACHNRYLAFSPGGNIFSCAEFDSEDSIIGNFLKQTPKEFLHANMRELLANKAPVPDKCHKCKYEPTCHGGCLRERYMLGYSYRCESNKMYWDHIVKWIESKGGTLYMLRDKPLNERKRIINQLFNQHGA